ncbi:MAG: hypothetical protein JO288_08950 [Hyphomicrobiales bacterium]|nr:hypothetical protein [Hyphomicrobiales bacterium]
MKRFVLLALLMAAPLTGGVSRAAGPEIRKCDFEVKARCASGEARVTLLDGLVQRLEVDVDWCAKGGGPGYSCTIDSSRGDADSRWSQEGGATIIANAAPFNGSQPDLVRVTVGRYVSIDLEQAQSLGRCGAGAELPRAIVIPALRGPCRMWFGKR